MKAASRGAPRIVLDTNVCLDLFLFQDPRCARLRAALDAGAVSAVTREDCAAEWERVLHYPGLPIDAAVRPALAAAYARSVQRLAPAAAVPDPARRLPRCADPDDQKFLELAAAPGACWLVSRDKALLALDRRARRHCGFAIVPPDAWPAPAA